MDIVRFLIFLFCIFQIVAILSCLFVVASTLSLIISTMPMFQVVSTIFIVSYTPNTYEFCMLTKNKKRNKDVKNVFIHCIQIFLVIMFEMMKLFRLYHLEFNFLIVTLGRPERLLIHVYDILSKNLNGTKVKCKIIFHN